MRQTCGCLLASLALALTGCASLTLPGPQPAQQVASKRSYHENLNLTGRLSVRYQVDGEDEALHGSFNWEQRAEHTSVTLLSPLGQTVAVIDVIPGSATLTRSGQATRVASNVDTLTAQTLGWPLPVAGLREWLQGFVVSPQGEQVAVDTATVNVNSTDGWQIHYASWSDDPRATTRPRRIDLRRPTPQGGEVSIRIVIDTWQTL